MKWCWGLDGTEACTPVVPEHFVSHWALQCETKRRAGKRANAKPIPADRFARLAKARHYASSCAPRVGDVDASELMVPARGSHHVGYLLKARKAARRPSRRMLDAATCAFRRRLAARASVVAAALAFPFAFAPARVGMLQAEVVGRGITLLLVEEKQEAAAHEWDSVRGINGIQWDSMGFDGIQDQHDANTENRFESPRAIFIGPAKSL